MNTSDEDHLREVIREREHTIKVLQGNADAMERRIWDLEASAEAAEKRIADLVVAYDHNNPLRTADVHPLDCTCMRCAIDKVRVALEAKP